MPRCQASADIDIELIVTVAGEFTEADPSSGTGEEYTADTIEDLRLEWWEHFPIEDEFGCQTGVGKRMVKSVSILAGVNAQDKAVRKLLSNLLMAYETEADEALREANV